MIKANLIYDLRHQTSIGLMGLYMKLGHEVEVELPLTSGTAILDTIDPTDNPNLLVLGLLFDDSYHQYFDHMIEDYEYSIVSLN